MVALLAIGQENGRDRDGSANVQGNARLTGDVIGNFNLPATSVRLPDVRSSATPPFSRPGAFSRG